MVGTTNVEDADKRACSSSKKEAYYTALVTSCYGRQSKSEAADLLHKKLQVVVCVLSANRSSRSDL